MKLNILSALLVASMAMSSVVVAADIPVSVAPVKSAPLTSEVNIHGTIFGRGNVDLTAGSAGLLMSVVEPGTLVNQGDVVARLDLLPLQLRKAEQQALIKRAKVNLQYQKIELTRLEKLAKTDAAAAHQVDLVKNQHDLARSDIEIAEVRLRQIEDQINRATVKAPFSGVVSARFLQAGRDVNRGDRLVHLVDTHTLEARFFVPVKYLKYVKPGLDIRFSSGDFDAVQQGQAKVSAVIPATDPRSQTFEVRAELANVSNGWASGQLVDVVLPIQKTKAGLLIDRDALIFRRDGAHIVKIDKDNKAHKVPVIVGKGQDQWIEVISKDAALVLAEGDRVAIRGAERLSEGQTVSVQ